MIKYKLNDFQADWAAMPQVEKEELLKLKHKTIVVSGHALARCLCYALLFQNETRGLDCRVILAAKDKSLIANLYAELILRDDFDFIESRFIGDIQRADVVIHTGFCCEQMTRFSAVFQEEIENARAVCALAQATGARLVLLSDSRVYGQPRSHRVYAENEYAAMSNTTPDFSEHQLLRAIEAMVNCEQKARGFELTTLRTGVILAACAGIPSFLDGVFEAVAHSKEISLLHSRQKYSFVSLVDVLHAVIGAVTTLKTNEVYNVAGSDATLSTASVAAILHDMYGDNARITLTYGKEFAAAPLSAGKIDTYGCPAAVSIETMLALCVMSRLPADSISQMPQVHDGRLTAIQKIQLAYLLEVDRICRRHHIKYFLGGGTLLGAIRHHGFIPWDDDSDIMMLREDYDKFCEIAAAELPPGMSFQSGKTDRHCFYEFAKLRIDGTAFATEFAREHKEMHNGIAFDIFCHDKTANSKIGQKLHLAMTLFTRALVFNKWNNRKTDNGSRVQTAVTNFCVRLFPLRFSYWLMNHTISFFKEKKNAKYLYDGMGRNVYRGVFPSELLNQAIEWDFEGYPLPVPEQYDAYLRFLYGDYMELPPLSTRTGCHEILLCDIGQYDGLNDEAIVEGNL